VESDAKRSVLFLRRVESGKDPITERDLHPIAALADWGRQRGSWEKRVERR